MDLTLAVLDQVFVLPIQAVRMAQGRCGCNHTLARYYAANSAVGEVRDELAERIGREENIGIGEYDNIPMCDAPRAVHRADFTSALPIGHHFDTALYVAARNFGRAVCR